MDSFPYEILECEVIFIFTLKEMMKWLDTYLTKLWTWWYHPLGTKMISFRSWVHSHQTAYAWICNEHIDNKDKGNMEYCNILENYLLEAWKLCFWDIAMNIIHRGFEIPTWEISKECHFYNPGKRFSKLWRKHLIRSEQHNS